MWSYVNWIDANRALPTRGKCDAFLVTLRMPDGARHVDCLIIDTSLNPIEWCELSGETFRGPGEVTHWAAFPSLPAESIRDVLARERAVAAIDRGERAAVG